MEGKGYALMVVRDGRIKYYCDDGFFWPGKNNYMHKVHVFPTKAEAFAMYDNWALRHPTTAHEWLPRVKEI